MSSVWLLAQGIVIGFAIAVPVGPVGVLCIRRSLKGGLMAGLACGLAAATADAVYGAVAGFGLASVIDLLDSYRGVIRLLGGLVLCVLGARVLRLDPEVVGGVDGNRGAAGAFVSCFLLALANPATVFAFLAVFAGVGPELALEGYGATAILVAGVFAGAAFWWLLLSGAASRFRDRLSLHAMAWLNRASGLLILAFGLVALAAYAARVRM